MVLPIADFQSPKYFSAACWVSTTLFGSVREVFASPVRKLKSNILKNCGSAINTLFASLNFLSVEPLAAVTFTWTPLVPKIAAAFVN